MQEAAALQILAQRGDLVVAELISPWPVTCRNGNSKERRIGESYAPLRALDRQLCALGDGGEQVGQARRIGVPVATALVLQARDREARRLRFTLGLAFGTVSAARAQRSDAVSASA